MEILLVPWNRSLQVVVHFYLLPLALQYSNHHPNYNSFPLSTLTSSENTNTKTRTRAPPNLVSSPHRVNE